ncbi:signal peptidase II, partial [Escherichia coli]|nr:signal peptidase II [Escherichia coli]
QERKTICDGGFLGGGLGHSCDRPWAGLLCRLIAFYDGGWHFGPFTLADTAIWGGAALIVLEGFLPSKAKKQ